MIMSAPRSMASSTTAATGSTASRIEATGASGSPQMSPLESQDSASLVGAAASTRATTSATVSASAAEDPSSAVAGWLSGESIMRQG